MSSNSSETPDDAMRLATTIADKIIAKAKNLTGMRVGGERSRAFSALRDEFRDDILLALAASCATGTEDAASLDVFERAWIIIANVGGGDWTSQSDAWRDAAKKFREDYHRALASRPSLGGPASAARVKNNEGWTKKSAAPNQPQEPRLPVEGPVCAASCQHWHRVIHTVSPQSVASTCASPIYFAPYDVADCEDCGAKNVGLNFTVGPDTPPFGFTFRVSPVTEEQGRLT